METIALIKQQITDNSVLLYMKGSPDMPQCGFSARAVNCLKDLGIAFAFVDVLANPEIRRELPIYAEWPTFPQLWVKGELIGGSDIIAEMHASGELKTIITNS